MKRFMFLLSIIFFHVGLMGLPEGFVYLDEVDSTIVSSLRYASEYNFVGRRIAGYSENPRVIVTEETAYALKKAQSIFKEKGYCLVVYDAYRPQKSVDFFVIWSQDSQDQVMKTIFYPRVNKEDVFDLGYVAKKSGHTRGSTVDVSLLKAGTSLTKANPVIKTLLNGLTICYSEDGTIDMGGSFDYFDEVSHTDYEEIPVSCKENRQLLSSVMKSVGFKGLEEEWWHFTLKDEPFPDTYFDFDME